MERKVTHEIYIAIVTHFIALSLGFLICCLFNMIWGLLEPRSIPVKVVDKKPPPLARFFEEELTDPNDRLDRIEKILKTLVIREVQE